LYGKHKSNGAAIKDVFRNPTLATISNITSSHTVFKMLNEIAYAMVLDLWESGKVCYNQMVEADTFSNDD
jgi:hypothetical protein